MVDAETSQPGDGLSLDQVLQTDGALSAVFTEHVRCTHTHTKRNQQVASSLRNHVRWDVSETLTVVGQGRRREAAQQVILDPTPWEGLGAEGTADIWRGGEQRRQRAQINTVRPGRI